MTSCLTTEEDDDLIISKDAQLTVFALSSKSIPELNATEFSIDQVNSVVYNVDSLPCNTNVNFNAMVSYRTGSGVSDMITRIDGDTVIVESGDSIEIGKMTYFDLYAPNGDKKTYTFKLNIHKVDADSMQYQLWVENANILLSGDNHTVKGDSYYYTYVKDNDGLSVYQSDNLIDWEEQVLDGLPEDVVLKSILKTGAGFYSCAQSGNLFHSTNGLEWVQLPVEYPVKSLIGYLNSNGYNNSSQGVCIVFEKEQRRFFGLLNAEDARQPVIEGEQIPEDFPQSDFSIVANPSVDNSSILLVGGLTSIWATENGTYWTKFGNSSQNNYDINGGNAFIYDNKLYYIGGKFSDGRYNEDVYTSINGGVFWTKQDSNTHAPLQFIQREGASVVVDKNEIFFYIIGGKNTNRNPVRLTDIWKVGLTSRMFEN